MKCILILKRKTFVLDKSTNFHSLEKTADLRMESILYAIAKMYHKNIHSYYLFLRQYFFKQIFICLHFLKIALFSGKARDGERREGGGGGEINQFMISHKNVTFNIRLG